MKVADIMHTSLVSVSEETPVKEALRLMFGIGISGVPVLKDKKLVGIVTEQDILSRLFPSMEDLVEDYAHASDFESMEKNLARILDAPVSKIMNKRMRTIAPSTPLMRAQSMMLLYKFSRLPVVDKNNALIGIISQGDIFRQLLRDEIPQLEKDRYADFIANHFDDIVDWERRYKDELPTMFGLLKKVDASTIIDVGAWTGEYTLGIVKKSGYSVLGLDHNMVMIKKGEEKRAKLPSNLKKRVSFMLTDYIDLSKQVPTTFDAAICMGNSLPYVPVSVEALCKGVSSVLREKNAIFVIQILNFEKILKTQSRLISFDIKKAGKGPETEHLAVEFFDKQDENTLLHHVILFDSDGKNWLYKGITTIPIKNIDKKDLEVALKNAGFSDVSFSGTSGQQSEFGALSFDEALDVTRHDWINVIAKR